MAKIVILNGDDGLIVRNALNSMHTELYEKADEATTAIEHAGLTDNPHSVSKDQIGLSDVDNTSDASKPVSVATQAQIDLKAGVSHTHSEYSSTDHEHDADYEPIGTSTTIVDAHIASPSPHPQYLTVSDLPSDAPVTSINGKVGIVVLSPQDVGSAPSGHTHDGVYSYDDHTHVEYEALGTSEAGISTHETEFDHDEISHANLAALNLVTGENTGDQVVPVNVSDLVDDIGIITNETDPVFQAWDKKTGISITKSQISDLPNYLLVETDPIFTAWNKSDGISITESQISDFGDYADIDHTHGDFLEAETDPIFVAWDKSSGISITEDQITDLQNYSLDSHDHAGAYLESETDPIATAALGIHEAADNPHNIVPDTILPLQNGQDGQFLYTEGGLLEWRFISDDLTASVAAAQQAQEDAEQALSDTSQAQADTEAAIAQGLIDTAAITDQNLIDTQAVVDQGLIDTQALLDSSGNPTEIAIAMAIALG